MPSKIVKELKEKAYHTRAADMSFNVSGLELTEDQKRALRQANEQATAQQAKQPGTW